MEKFDLDFRRYDFTQKKGLKKAISIARSHILRAIWYERRMEMAKSRALKRFCAWRSRKLFGKNHCEISLKNIEGGILLNHPYDIIINSHSRIGKDFTIFKGAVIGSIRSGKKKGTPKIGDRVTVCTNAFVCGNITIGDDVLIAANAYVNFDVPSNSVVIGNPGVIHHKENPSADYLPDYEKNKRRPGY